MGGIGGSGEFSVIKDIKGCMDTIDSQDGLKTIALPLFLNIFFYFLPTAVLCDDFSLVDSA